MNAFIQSLRGLGPMRLAAMAGVGIGVLVFFIYLTTRMASPQLELLYGDLQLADANQIVKQLEAQKVPFEIRRDGTEIWVPKDKKLPMRVKMAEQSLPSGGTVSAGYEIFDNGDVLSQTTFLQNLKLVRALEGELARTIRSMDRIDHARVHLVMPKREMFSRETQDPSASVIVKTKGGTLNPSQVQAIQHVVASAVPRLKPSRISIADERGRLLARGFEDDQSMVTATMEERRLAEQQRLNDKIIQILGRIVGADNIKAEVTVEMDYDRVATTQEIYDPNGQVVRSQVTVEENENSEDREQPSVSVAQNLPDAQASQSGAKSSSNQARTQETVNFEITKKVVNQVKEIGEIKRISAAVAINGVVGKDANGQETYQPRDKQTMESLAAAVRSAIGYDANRGDVIEVVNLRFATLEDPFKQLDDTKIWGFEREFLEQIAQNLGLFIVAVLFLLLVLKPLITRAVESMGPGGVPDSRRLLTDQAQAPPQLTGPAGVPANVPGLSLPDESELDELIDLDKVEGRVKASSIRKIGEIVEKHPEEALSIIRNWMYQET